MSNRKHFRQPRPIPIGRHEISLSKLGARRFNLRDPYHLAVSLPWPGFVMVMLAGWLAINLVFASLYMLRPGDVANSPAGSFADMFFFSIETLATVGYGVMSPVTIYSHIVSAVEVVTGTAFTAIVTGLLFVRFSRAKPDILSADHAVVSMRNGHPTLMLRIVNRRDTMMSSATARLFVLIAEQTAEGRPFRRIHELHLEQEHLPLFIMPWTLMHVIAEKTPLHGHDVETLAGSGIRLFLTIEVRDHALSSLVYDIKDYAAEDIRFGKRFADMVSETEAGGAIADLSRISLLETDNDAAAEPEIRN